MNHGPTCRNPDGILKNKIELLVGDQLAVFDHGTGRAGAGSTLDLKNEKNLYSTCVNETLCKIGDF